MTRTSILTLGSVGRPRFATAPSAGSATVDNKWYPARRESRFLNPKRKNTMAAYLVVDTKLTNPALYEEYKLRARPLVEKFGGEYIARGGNISLKESALWTPTRMVLVRFPSSADAEKFYQSAEYQEVVKISKQSAERTSFVLEGI